MKELENGKKKLLITGIILIIITACAAGILAYGSHKNQSESGGKNVQEEKCTARITGTVPCGTKEQEQEARSIAEARIAEGTFRGTEP